MVNLDTLAIAETGIIFVDPPAEQEPLYTACEEQVAFADCTEGHFAVSVQVGDLGQILRIEHVDRTVRSVHQQMLIIYFAQQASLSIVEVVSLGSLFKGCRSVKAFCNLPESLRVHTFLVE